MINREKGREEDDLQRLSPELRRSLNKGLKQFCITSGSSVIKHSMKLEGENDTLKGVRTEEENPTSGWSL